MLKLLNKKILYGITILALMFSPFTIAQNESQVQDIKENGQLNMVQNDVKINDFDIEPIDTQKIKKSVIPDTKKEGRKVINLFLRVMTAVLFSALVLYLVLLIIKKYYGSAFAIEDTEEEENVNLNPPNNKEEALKSFLDRTK